MPKAIFVPLFLLSTSLSFSQKLYFAKANYQDSVALAANIVVLAKQAVLLFKNNNLETYLDNIFRLQAVAGMSKEMHLSLKKMDYLLNKDSISPTALGFQYQMYREVLDAQPTTDDFERTYTSIFYKKYNAYNQYNKTWLSGYFNYSIDDLKTKFNSLKTEYQKNDSLSVDEATMLCRTYLSYYTYSKTQSIAQKILAKIDDETYATQDSILIKMPDGGTISMTVVYGKKDSLPLPVVLMYDIYAGGEISRCKQAADRGYIGVVANTRGKLLSKDNVNPFEYDAKDAYHIIDWISKQTWCNGKIGMYGGSYLGFSQWSATKYLHPALTTIVPQASVGVGIDFPLRNGTFSPYMLQWIRYVTDNKLTNEAGFNNTTKWNKLRNLWYKSGQRFRSLDSLEGATSTIFQRWLQHPSYDTFWKNMIPQKEEYANINIPVLSTTGYWDSDQLGAIHYYREHHTWNNHPNHYLVIGPYDHGGSQGYPSNAINNYTIDSIAMESNMDLVFGWFDYTLKNGAKPPLLKDKVNFQIMGKNEWRSVPSLNKMANDTLHFYLTNSPSNNYYHLSLSKPAKLGFINQENDFKDRSDYALENDNIDWWLYPNFIDSTIRCGKNKLVFVSDAIDTTFAISGSIIPIIVASINKKDMDVTLDLLEQTPDGKYFVLNQNLQRASYAKDPSKRQLLTPNKMESFHVNNTFITCKQLQKGSRIVIVLGVNKSPHRQINYGTGKDVSDETISDARIPLRIKWYNTSCVKIPILRN